jgi:beta-N-acetylhexosaminidase
MVYTQIDPDNCTTFSSELIHRIIREQIGFDGLLLTDDLSMKALDGSFQSKAERSLAAGCDMLLHCNGEIAEMLGVAHGASRLDGKAQERAEAALQTRGAPQTFDADAALGRLEDIFSDVGLEAVS